MISSNDPASFGPVDVIVTEDGPRITLSFPQIGPFTQPNTGSGNMSIQSLNFSLPKSISPNAERGEYQFTEFSNIASYSLPGIKTSQILLFHIFPNGTFIFDYLSPQTNFVTFAQIFPFCVTYDTGNYN